MRIMVLNQAPGRIDTEYHQRVEPILRSYASPGTEVDLCYPDDMEGGRVMVASSAQGVHTVVVLIHQAYNLLAYVGYPVAFVVLGFREEDRQPVRQHLVVIRKCDPHPRALKVLLFHQSYAKHVCLLSSNSRVMPPRAGRRVLRQHSEIGLGYVAGGARKPMLCA